MSLNSKKKRKLLNPLAAARPKNKDTLWHVKSGAGWELFREYYWKQPVGIVCDAKQETERTIANLKKEPSHGAYATAIGQGLSRAAKRRKRKRGEIIIDTATSVAKSQQDDPIDIPSPLINARLLEQDKDTAAAYSPSFQSFLESLTKPLPVSFRIRTHVPKCQQETIQQRLMDEYRSILSSSALVPNTYQVSLHDLKQNDSLTALLQEHTSNGAMSRQEIASMLPVLAMRAYHEQDQTKKNNHQPHIKRILDVCSAPGSKTLQLAEWMLERNRQQLQSSTNRPLKPTTIRANDVHPQRLEALKDAIQRSGVFAKNTTANVSIKYTNQDASHYTDIHSGSKTQKQYDLILADVPCSGDGTCRKDARILPYWTPSTAHALHALQCNILKRTLQLVKVGGLVCYSTCSLNPMENEAVVAGVLKDMSGGVKVELVPIDIEGLKAHRPGAATWRVADYTNHDADVEDDTERARLTWYDSYEQAIVAGMELAVPTMWPPDKDGERVPLERCLRLWPQEHDTGGFFVALLERLE